MKIHRERTKDGIRVIFSRIKKKRMVERFAKDGQKVAVHARRGRSRNGSNVRRCLLSRIVPLFSAKSNTGYATYQEHFAIHLLPLPSLSPFFLGANNAIQPCTLKFLSRVSRRVLDNERARRRKGRARRKSREAGKNEGGKRGRE